MECVALRSPDVVMRLDRLGASHPTRLSFLRALIRRAARERWRFRRVLWSMDDAGHGAAVHAVDAGSRTYSLVAFSAPLEDSRRTDRVIAEAWDTSYVLYDGVPTTDEIERLRAAAPRQEAARFTARDLVLARANKSVRLFDSVVDALAAGRQPDVEEVLGVGYLMRTTAVYGNGKFGIADRDEIAARPELSGPFQAEMLTVWLIRSFTFDLAEHVATRRSPGRAARLDRELRRGLGVGNATGLGMAPFLARHPVLMHNWFHTRETALARVRAVPEAPAKARDAFTGEIDEMRARVARWRTADAEQREATRRLAGELARLAAQAPALLASHELPWDAVYRFAEDAFSLEGQEATVALLLEPHGDVVDDLAATMADETCQFRIDGGMTCEVLRASIARHYAWAMAFDFREASANARFWYVSEEKLEPRLGERFQEPGAEREQPLAIARDVAALALVLETEPPETRVADFLARRPEWRHIVRRVAIVAAHPYAEVRGNLIDANMRPVDLLRAKLAFFGARNFDPRSDRWLRIALFAGEPLVEDIAA